MKFKIGQKVIFVKPDTGLVPFGAEGFIVSCDCPYDYVVNFPKYRCLDNTYEWWANEYQLEPIDYDGNEKVSWEECEWKPTKEYLIA